MNLLLEAIGFFSFFFSLINYPRVVAPYPHPTMLEIIKQPCLPLLCESFILGASLACLVFCCR